MLENVPVQLRQVRQEVIFGPCLASNIWKCMCSIHSVYESFCVAYNWHIIVLFSGVLQHLPPTPASSLHTWAASRPPSVCHGKDHQCLMSMTLVLNLLLCPSTDTPRVHQVSMFPFIAQQYWLTDCTAVCVTSSVWKSPNRNNTNLSTFFQ